MEKNIKTFFIILFVIFITMYIINNNGYYEYKLNKSSALTKDEIERFENDIKIGKDINIEEYNKDISYNNKVSEVSSKISYGVGDIFKNTIKNVINELSKFFT